MTTHVENLTPLKHAAQNRCFGCGPVNPHGLQLEFLIADDGSIVSHATISDDFCGHPGYLHGGIIATLLDEAMSKAVRATGVSSMTRHLEIDYLLPVPSAKPIRLEGRVVRTEGRKRWADARIRDQEGKTLAHGKGLFVEVRPREAKS
ncbi:MAG: PaaI family thioesterase, partial [Terracidiphilus sp.]